MVKSMSVGPIHSDSVLLRC